MLMTLICLSEMLLLEVNMFGTVMTHPIIRERMSLVELLEREHNLHVSNTEFKGIFFKKRICLSLLNSAIHREGRSNLLKDNIRNS